MHDICLASKRLSMRPFCADDADAAFSCITPSLTRFMSWDPPASREDFDRVWQSWLPSMQDGIEFVFAIRQRRDGYFLGLAGLHNVRSASPELGIWIRENRHHEGFGREAVTLVLKWVSRNFHANKFIYPVAEENTSSRRIAESLGGVVVEKRETPKYPTVVYQIPAQNKKPQR
ncbi:GNAT family N-acetyltransferase [Dyella sp. M7H15-1]|uniref:GNAT family N-acetyltransferase n=1 Tax=Dyella sp. M7H15-1 TaxID=2501295 RepID=UPI00197ADF43|nr:GNAT family N-acetyltransferase [Dyella sp. M7H15-1]